MGALLDTSAWSFLVNNSYADYAIGSPTLPMLLDSWNQKNHMPMTYNLVNNDGFYVYDADGNIEYRFLEGWPGFFDRLYFPFDGYVDNGESDISSYWLSSPAGDDGDGYIMSVDWPIHSIGSGFRNFITCDDYCGDWLGVRPVVRCLSDVYLTPGEEYDYNLNR